ncbi:MAG: energy transducer TonB [Myxococcales bacterium]|nr:MAG: energy transducer TonB [Myxococcales bacterium]
MEEHHSVVPIEFEAMPLGDSDIDDPGGPEEEKDEIEPEPQPSPAARSVPETLAAAETQTLTAAEGSDSTEIIDLESVVLSNAESSDPKAIPSVGSGKPKTRTGSGEGSGSGQTFGSPDGIVSVSNLARKPAPPSDIQNTLERNYPKQAQRLGIEGTARLKLRINPDGRPSNFKVLSQTGSHGFAEACSKTLSEGRWQPPLDKNGKAVATEISFTCVFEIRY